MIKVVTDQQGFVWEGRMLGITKVEKKTGEYWVYLPRRAKKITIKHDKLGVLRDYVFPTAIKKATVYEMKLTTGEVLTEVKEKEIPSQWLIIKTKPKGANVFIKESLAGSTPFQRKYKEGEYTYRLEKPRYHNKAGKINLGGEKKKLNLTLKPQFGEIKVASEPEDSMLIYLDDEYTGKKTPATLKKISSGEHRLELQSRWYQPKTKKVTVKDEQTTDVQFTLKPAFANISVDTDPSATILVDGQRKGKGNWGGSLMEGISTIKAEKDKYYNQSEQLEVTPGEGETLNFELEGKTGNVDIVTTPMEAEVYVNGEKKGTSPLTLNDLLIGEYQLKLEKNGYGTITKTFTIEEGETKPIKEQLPAEKEITLTSQPTGAKIYIDDKLQGKTPQTITLSFGEHRVKMINKEMTGEEEIEISQNEKNSWKFELTKKNTFIDSRDGKTYKWARIGNQAWMAENLAYDAGEGCWAYENKQKNVEKYGYLYKWETAKKACPDGWHLPSDEEWKELAEYISKDNGGYTKDGDDWKHVGAHLKATSGWKSGENGIDDYGFTAFPGGQPPRQWEF